MAFKTQQENGNGHPQSHNSADSGSVCQCNTPSSSLSSHHSPKSGAVDPNTLPDSHSPHLHQDTPAPVAIIGLACRLPGQVTTAEELWELCSRSRSGWSKIPADRFSHDAYHHPDPEKRGCYNAEGAHFIAEDPALFDASFFNINEKEAISLDPQQRLLLECTYEALENAGLSMRQLAGQSVGVFVGGSYADYELNNVRDLDTAPMYQATGCAAALLSNRISHFFDFRGPSFTVDTACSSSLTALHMAVQSLEKGESDLAIVGGAHLNITPDLFVTMSTSNLFSDEGRCFSFDNRGSGYGRGEGIGCIVLRSLDKALHANDAIRAIVKGTGIGQDGRTKGITMPSGPAQAALIKAVYRRSCLSPALTAYVEAHGTGTAVGDPIEAAALHEVFSTDRDPSDRLFVGSVKSNVGHLEGASGVISVIKTAMMLQKGWILPNYDFTKPNEKIPLTRWNLEVPTKQRPWPTDRPLASINNFGFGGANAHAILQRHPRQPRPRKGMKSLPRKLLVISGYDLQALERRASDLTIFLEQRPEVFEQSLLTDLAYTLGQRREHFQYRAAVTATDASELTMNLLSSDLESLRSTNSPKIVFVFTGQGAQWYAMGRELIVHYPIFRKVIEHADHWLMKYGAVFSLKAELCKDASNSIISTPDVSQPACTAIQLALTDLLSSWGVVPSAVIGHSSGEIAAAYAAGCLGIEQCMAIAYYRGQCITLLKKRHPCLRGSMMAIGTDRTAAHELVKGTSGGEVKVACVNSPHSVTVAGDDSAISQVATLCEARSLFHRKLHVDVAYHSHHMRLVADDYYELIKDIAAAASSTHDIQFYSSLYGRQVDGSSLNAAYWVDNLVSPVQFADGLQTLYESARPQVAIELGPHSVLHSPIKEILGNISTDAAKVHYVSALVRGQDSLRTSLRMAADLFTRGVSLNMQAINFPSGLVAQAHTLTDLPRYPWNHEKSYWHHSRVSRTHRHKGGSRNDILGSLAVYSNDIEPIWRIIIRTDEMPWLRQHKMQSLFVYPLAGYISMAIEAMDQRASQRGLSYDTFQLREIVISRPMVLRDNRDVEINLALRSHSQGTRTTSDKWEEFRVFSYENSAGWIEHCRGLITVKTCEQKNPVSTSVLVDETRARDLKDAVIDAFARDLNTEDIYAELESVGAEYGPVFRGLENCRIDGLKAVAHTSLLSSAETMPKGYESKAIIHPATLDQVIQLMFPMLGAGQKQMATLFMPSFVRELTVSSPIRHKSHHKLRVYGSLEPGYSKSSARKCDLYATSLDDSVNKLIQIQGLTVSPVATNNAISGSAVPRELCFRTEWQALLPEQVREVRHLTNDPADNALHPTPLPPKEVSIICTSKQQALLASKLRAYLERELHITVEIEQFDYVVPVRRVYIVIAELERSLLLHMSKRIFDTLQNLVSTAHSILWASCSADPDSRCPASSISTGLARTVRCETAMPFITVDFDCNNDDDAIIASLFDIFSAVVITKDILDMEFRYRNGRLWTPKLVPQPNLDTYVHKKTSSAAREIQPFQQGGRHLRFDIESPGALDTLYFTDDYTMSIPLQNLEVEIEIKATGVNFKDVMIAMGQLSSPYIGIECSGVVSRLGTGVEDLKIGDRVVAMVEGAYSTYGRCLSTSVHRIPKTTTFEQAASIPVAFCTAYYALFDLARLNNGERVLIHAAAGGVGQAAVALCQMIGAEIFATVGSQSKKHHLMDHFGIAEDHILYSRDTSFAADIRRLTNHQGVDVVLNSLAGDFLRETWECLSKFGRFIEIGKKDIVNNFHLEMGKFEQNVVFASVDLTLVAAERPYLMKRILDDVFNLLDTGLIQPMAPVTLFRISDVEGAFRTLQSGKSMGKIVVTAGEGDQVKAVPRKVGRGFLTSYATYIIVGGTGGIGQRIGRWMIEKGAKHVVLLSRTGIITPALTEMIDHARSLQATVQVRACDVSEKTQVTRLLEHDLHGMPPVKGLVHGAMVLHDVLFEKMTYDQWEEVMKAKVAGCRNLHQALQGSVGLEFFIALSSVAGIIGNRGQAAYAAANCYLDAMMESRRDQGLPGTSIALCGVSDVGYLAANPERLKTVNKNLGIEMINEEEIMALIAAAIDGSMAETCGSGCITGLSTQGSGNEPYWMTDAKFADLRTALSGSHPGPDAAPGVSKSLKSSLRGTTVVADAQTLVCEALVTKIASVLMLLKSDLSISEAPANYGLDSLAAIEIRNWITREMEANLAVLELLTSESFSALAALILEKSRIWTVGK